MTPEAQGHCLAHGAPAVATCSRCGIFLCDGCRSWLVEKPYCKPCRERLGHTPSKEASRALLLAVLGWTCLVPGIFAYLLGRAELRRIAKGEASPAGEAMASAGRTLGFIQMLLIPLVVWALVKR